MHVTVRSKAIGKAAPFESGAAWRGFPQGRGAEALCRRSERGERLEGHGTRGHCGRHASRALRPVALVTLLLLGFYLFAPAAQARDLLLYQDTEPGPEALRAYGWTFATLTLVSLGYAALAYTESQNELDDAESNYKKYKAATTTDDALLYRARVVKHHDDAEAAETRANIALTLAAVFALTAYFSFSPEALPSLSVTASLEGPVLEWRF
jgi:hypothetical protein